MYPAAPDALINLEQTLGDSTELTVGLTLSKQPKGLIWPDLLVFL